MIKQEHARFRAVAILLSISALAAALLGFPAAQAQEQVFHNGDHVLITPYGGAWAECTLTSDRQGYTNDYSYSAVCAPMSAASTPDNRPHLYSSERVKSVNDPAAQAGLAQMRAQFPPYKGPNPAQTALATPHAVPQTFQPQTAPQQPARAVNPPPQTVAQRAPNPPPPPRPPAQQPRVQQASAQPAGPGGVFKSPDQCKVGTRVTDKDNKTGTITGIDGYMSLCQVKLDNGTQNYYLFWMLRTAGTSAETNDNLVPGTYECYASGNYTFMDISITGPNSYSSAGAAGRFHVTPARDIVFENGPLSKYHAHLKDGPSIGLNSNGDSFYGTTCDLKK